MNALNLTVGELYFTCNNISANTVFCVFRDGKQLVCTEYHGLVNYYKNSHIKSFKIEEAKTSTGGIKVERVVVNIR